MNPFGAWLWVCSLGCGFGVSVFLASIVIPPAPRQPRSRRPRISAAAASLSSAAASAVTFELGHALVAVGLAGLAFAAMGLLVWLLRAARGGGQDGGGGDGGAWDDPLPPDDGPGGGIAIDWEAFEEAFWAYCEQCRHEYA